MKKPNSLEWYQTDNTITIHLPCPGTSLKKIDFFLTDHFLKINFLERNLIKFIDFSAEIDFQSKANTFLLINEKLEITLAKQSPGPWGSLLLDGLDRKALISRRESATQRKNEAEQAFLKKRQDIKIKYDQHSVSEQMRLDRNEREFIETRKKEERETAEKELYDTIALKQLEKNRIFGEEDLTREEEVTEAFEIPEPREQKSMKLQFTEKVYPHLAAREQHFRDAPMPKTKTIGGRVEDGENSENPLWLKDKADDFYRNKDFYSALNAYNSAIQKNPKFIQCIANRAACHLALFNFTDALRDSDEVLSQLASVSESERANFGKILLRTKARKAVALSWEGSSLEAAEKLFEEVISEANGLLSEEVQRELSRNYERLLKRKQSLEWKTLGDHEFKALNLTKSLELYQRALSFDPENEIILGNISLIHSRLNNPEQGLSFLEKSLSLINSVISAGTLPNQGKPAISSEIVGYIVKLLSRKSEFLEALSKPPSELQQTLTDILRLDPSNKTALAKQALLLEKAVIEEIAGLKSQAAEMVQKSDFQSALVLYAEILKKVNTKSIEGVVEFLACLLNKAICHTMLEEYDDVINIGIRGVKLIRGMKSGFAGENKKLSKEIRNKLVGFEVRFLMRRSNAFLKQNQLFNAKGDLEEALALDPSNSEIASELEKIKSISL